MNVRGNRVTVLLRFGILVVAFVGFLPACTAHTVSVTVESKRGSDIGDGTVWSTYAGSGGPINCSNLAITTYNPQFDVQAYNPQSYTKSSVTNAICAAKFPEGTGVVLFSSPAKQNLFTGWTGACNATGASPCTIDVTSSLPSVINVRAVFRQPTIKVEVKNVAIHADVTVKSSCRLGSASVPRVILHQGGNGTTSTGLPDDCDWHVLVEASPPPKHWSGTCAGNFENAGCEIFVSDDVSMTFDYGP